MSFFQMHVDLKVLRLDGLCFYVINIDAAFGMTVKYLSNFLTSPETVVGLYRNLLVVID